MQKIFFTSHGATVAGNLFLPDTSTLPPGVLFLYGGGRHVTKELFADFQQMLSTSGVASLAIDFPGDGESLGAFSEGTLAKRLEYAIAGYEQLFSYANPERIAVYGGSMGGYIAAGLVKKFPKTKALVLVAAAAYGKEAEHMLLGEEFTKALRKKDSWKNSRAFEIVKNFQGNTLVVYGQHDTIIPEEIKHTYLDLVKEKIIIANGGHRLFSPTNPQEEKAKEHMFQVIHDFLTKSV